MAKVEENKNGSITFICDCGNVYNISYNKETEKVELETVAIKPKEETKKKERTSIFGFTDSEE